MEGGGSPSPLPPPLDWETSKKLGMDILTQWHSYSHIQHNNQELNEKQKFNTTKTVLRTKHHLENIKLHQFFKNM